MTSAYKNFGLGIISPRNCSPCSSPLNSSEESRLKSLGSMEDCWIAAASLTWRSINVAAAHGFHANHTRADFIDWGFKRVLITKPPDGFTGFTYLRPCCHVRRPMCQRNIAYLNMYTYYTQVYYDSNFLCFFAFKNVYAPTCKHPPTEPETWANHPPTPNPPN